MRLGAQRSLHSVLAYFKIAMESSGSTLLSLSSGQACVYLCLRVGVNTEEEWHATCTAPGQLEELELKLDMFTQRKGAKRNGVWYVFVTTGVVLSYCARMTELDMFTQHTLPSPFVSGKCAWTHVHMCKWVAKSRNSSQYKESSMNVCTST